MKTFGKYFKTVGVLKSFEEIFSNYSKKKETPESITLTFSGEQVSLDADDERMDGEPIDIDETRFPEYFFKDVKRVYFWDKVPQGTLMTINGHPCIFENYTSNMMIGSKEETTLIHVTECSTKYCRDYNPAQYHNISFFEEC